MRFIARKCESLECGLRFPIDHDSRLGDLCPLCRSPTHPIDDGYDTYPAHATLEQEQPRGPELIALLDNIRSLSNVGAIFRSADGIAASHLYLGGFTPTPNHPKLAKTALGAESRIAWTHAADSLRCAQELVARGIRLWALEGGPRSTPLFAALPAVGDANSSPIALVVGHEVSGVDPRILELCTQVVRIPMLGHKGSLNVAVAFGVAAYFVRYAGQVESDL